MKPHFSLRTILFVTTALAIIIFWQSRPSQIASRFLLAIEAGDYDAADRLFQTSPKHSLSDLAKGPHRIQVTARREPHTLKDWVRGVSRLTIFVRDRGGWDSYTIGAAVEVSSRGVQEPTWTVKHVSRGPAILPGGEMPIRSGETPLQ